MDHTNNVESLRDLLQDLVSSGNDDSGFPILRADSHVDGLRLVGYIGANELEHALSKYNPYLRLVPTDHAIRHRG